MWTFLCRLQSCLLLLILSSASALLLHTSANGAICRDLYVFGENLMVLNDFIMLIIVFTLYIPLCLYILQGSYQHQHNYLLRFIRGKHDYIFIH